MIDRCIPILSSQNALQTFGVSELKKYRKSSGCLHWSFVPWLEEEEGNSPSVGCGFRESSELPAGRECVLDLPHGQDSSDTRGIG